MNVRHLLKDTVTIQSPTGASSGGDPVYGDAQHTIKARVEKKIRRVPSAQGWANISVDALVTDTEIKTNDLLWLPGADTTKRAEARRLGTVRTSTTFGGYRTYEVDLQLTRPTWWLSSPGRMPKIYCAACVVDDVYGSIAALVRKNRPDWQAGKLNFIGGKLEPGETPEQAEARELGEEAGLKLKPEQLQKVLVLIGKDHAYEVHFFRAVVPLEVVESARTMTDERIEIVDFDDLNPKETVPNLAWMIPMMRSHPRDAAWWYVVHEGQSEAPGPIPGLPTE